MVAGRTARDRPPPARAHELRGRARGRCARPAAPAAIAPARSRWRRRRCIRIRAIPRCARRSRRPSARASPRSPSSCCRGTACPSAFAGAVRRSLGLTDAEVELANRVDGRWDLLSLIRSADRARSRGAARVRATRRGRRGRAADDCMDDAVASADRRSIARACCRAAASASKRRGS